MKTSKLHPYTTIWINPISVILSERNQIDTHKIILDYFLYVNFKKKSKLNSNN